MGIKEYVTIRKTKKWTTQEGQIKNSTVSYIPTGCNSGKEEKLTLGVRLETHDSPYCLSIK